MRYNIEVYVDDLTKQERYFVSTAPRANRDIEVIKMPITIDGKSYYVRLPRSVYPNPVIYEQSNQIIIPKPDHFGVEVCASSGVIFHYSMDDHSVTLNLEKNASVFDLPAKNYTRVTIGNIGEYISYAICISIVNGQEKKSLYFHYGAAKENEKNWHLYERDVDDITITNDSWYKVDNNNQQKLVFLNLNFYQIYKRLSLSKGAEIVDNEIYYLCSKNTDSGQIKFPSKITYHYLIAKNEDGISVKLVVCSKGVDRANALYIETAQLFEVIKRISGNPEYINGNDNKILGDFICIHKSDNTILFIYPIKTNDGGFYINENNVSITRELISMTNNNPDYIYIFNDANGKKKATHFYQFTDGNGNVASDVYETSLYDELEFVYSYGPNSNRHFIKGTNKTKSPLGTDNSTYDLHCIRDNQSNLLVDGAFDIQVLRKYGYIAYFQSSIGTQTTLCTNDGTCIGIAGDMIVSLSKLYEFSNYSSSQEKNYALLKCRFQSSPSHTISKTDNYGQRYVHPEQYIWICTDGKYSYCDRLSSFFNVKHLYKNIFAAQPRPNSKKQIIRLEFDGVFTLTMPDYDEIDVSLSCEGAIFIAHKDNKEILYDENGLLIDSLTVCSRGQQLVMHHPLDEK